MTANPSASADAEAIAHVASVVRRSGSSFAVAMYSLPAVKREAMFAVYAFCRTVDDIADGAAPEGEHLARLDEWRDEIERLYAGRPGHPVTRALAAAVAAYGLRKEDFLTVIEGMEMDAGEALRIADDAHLMLYCDRVACAVGRLSNRVFGVDAAAGEAVARALGEALQLTNILRDLAEDARRNRLYLPADLLRAHGIGESDPAAVLAHPNLPAVCGEVAAMARRRFAEAEVAIAACDRRRLRPAAVMMEVYRRILGRLTARGWRRIVEPVALSRLEKLWIVLRYGMV